MQEASRRMKLKVNSSDGFKSLSIGTWWLIKLISLAFEVLDKEIRELDAQNKDSNYISEPWFDMYLRARESIVLNYNPFIAHAVDPNPKQMNQVKLCSAASLFDSHFNLIITSLSTLRRLSEPPIFSFLRSDS